MQEGSEEVHTGRLVSEITSLDSLYHPLRTRDNRKKVFLLQYLHAHLVLFDKFLEGLATRYVEKRSRDFDPRSSKMRGWVLKEMTKDAYQYRQFTNVGNQMTDTLESMIDVVKPLWGDTNGNLSFLTLEPELRGCCKDVRKRLSRLTEDMETSLKYLDLARNVGQTGNVQLLTILATVFLPLSLATGILSMQNRFKNLGPLLYDFFGVVSILLTAVLLILLTIIFFGIAQEQTSRYLGEKKFKLVYWVVGAITFLAVAVLGALVLSSFLVGMFKDIVLGAKILGFGFAIIIGAPPFLYFIYLICYAISAFFSWIKNAVMSSKNSNEHPAQEDVEKNLDRTGQQKVEPVLAAERVAQPNMNTSNEPAPLSAYSRTEVVADTIQK